MHVNLNVTHNSSDVPTITCYRGLTVITFSNESLTSKRSYNLFCLAGGVLYQSSSTALIIQCACPPSSIQLAWPHQYSHKHFISSSFDAIVADSNQWKRSPLQTSHCTAGKRVRKKNNRMVNPRRGAWPTSQTARHSHHAFVTGKRKNVRAARESMCSGLGVLRTIQRIHDLLLLHINIIIVAVFASWLWEKQIGRAVRQTTLKYYSYSTDTHLATPTPIRSALYWGFFLFWRIDCHWVWVLTMKPLHFESFILGI